MKKLCLLALIALIAMIAMPTTAQTITMANPSGIAERDIMVYHANGTLSGFYNSTSVITLDGTQDYIFTLKPMRTNPFEDPGGWLTDEFFPFFQTNITVLIIIGMIFGAVFFWRR